ncbi:MAG: hypothetical protein KAT05_15545 [Spirochaetes bacterium]|nr:hypothetical protein [Spirochaetota bacterium]
MTQDEILAEIKKHPDGIFRKDLVKKMGNSLQISQLRKKKLIYVKKEKKFHKYIAVET